MKHLLLRYIILVPLLIGCATYKAVKETSKTSIYGFEEIRKGMEWYRKGCYVKSVEHFFKAHEVFVSLDNISGIAMTMNNIGNVYGKTGDTQSAILFLDESIELYDSLNDKKGLMQALSNKAAVLIDCRRLDEASKILNKVESISKDNFFIPIFLNRGILFIKLKKFKEAEDVLIQALKNVNPIDNSEAAPINFALGNLMSETNRYKEAIFYFKNALEADKKSEFYQGIADDLSALGSVYIKQKNDKDAKLTLKRSAKLYSLIGNHNKANQILEQIKEDSPLTKYFINKALENPCK
ncbi:MAG: tetratricopeptide repeat protein [Desulfobacterales bacterium]|nr:tetratricopeptide repeat protein [Desulfobacterales bacterium]